YIAWVANGKLAWRLNVAGMGADTRVELSARPVPQEPMHIIANLGMSRNFGPVDLDNLVFPTTMSIDWVRVYQKERQHNIGCDPEDFPT
ncbi:SKN1-domain-containing protein, partial [Fistulina hepatica ATCC 64428]